ncbi:rhombosortase [Thermodesulfobacteriota bacterium]
MAPQRKIEPQGHMLTIFIAGFAIILYCFPRLSSLFIYDRQAILNGELWRLLTAPFVHFSGSHLFWNVLIFSMAGFAINVSKFPGFWIVCGISIALPGLIFLLAVPDMGYYGGLSGLATGAAAYYCFCSLFKAKRKKGIWLVILVVMFIKIIVEATLNESIFAHAEEVSFRVLPAAHIVGYLGALAAVIWSKPGIKLQEP